MTVWLIQSNIYTALVQWQIYRQVGFRNEPDFAWKTLANNMLKEEQPEKEKKSQPKTKC